MKNKLLILTAALAALALLAGCSGGQSSSAAPAPTPAGSVAAPTQSTATAESMAASADASEVTMTLEELAQYNGKDGNRAYVAVDGVIYDVTDVPQWANGDHYEGMTAGQDLTQQIKEISPHGVSVLEDLPVVGRLAS